MIIPAGRCFLRRLHDATAGARHLLQRVKVSDVMKADLAVWDNFLSKFNGRGLMTFGDPVSSEELHLYSDSSKQGYGGVYGTHFICGVFPDNWEKYDIQVKELYPILALIVTFADEFRNRLITMHCDNIAVVHSINNLTSRNKEVMALLRPLVLHLLLFNVQFKALHIPGISNNLCDKLSRQSASASYLQARGMDPGPTQIPPFVMPSNLVIS